MTKALKQSAAIAAGTVCLVLGILGAGQAQAASIAVTGSAPQTSAGEDFNFNFSPVAQSNGTDGILTIRARGDYSLNFPAFESLSWNIDGIVSQTQVAPTAGNVIAEFNFDDILWEENFTIGGFDLLNITADSVVSLGIDLLPDVNRSFTNAFVQVTLEYESEPASVPEPVSIMGLLAVGGIFVGSRAKRKG